MSNPRGAWTCLPFAELTAKEVYQLLQLRSEIFVVEQACAYLDPDGMDEHAWHWLYREDGALQAYQRCFAPGVAYTEASSIGRVIVAADARGRGLSRELLQRGIAFNRDRWPQHTIQISAQAYLEDLYRSLGFVVCGEPYLEDGIPHISMCLTP